MGKSKSEAKKGKPRSAGSRQAKINYYWTNSWPRNMAKRAFRVFKYEQRFGKTKDQAHDIALHCIRDRKPNTGFDLRALVETYYLKLYNAVGEK